VGKRKKVHSELAKLKKRRAHKARKILGNKPVTTYILAPFATSLRPLRGKKKEGSRSARKAENTQRSQSLENVK
jgi:hypothetical protein